MARSSSTETGKKDSASAMEAGLLRIWLVDDDECFRQLMAQLLNYEQGVECPRHFSSADAVLRALQEQSPDAILLDVEMPDMNGIEAIRPIKKLAPSIPVLMLTTFANCAAREQSLAAGAADYLLKRNLPEQIVAAIRTAKQLRGFSSHPAQM